MLTSFGFVFSFHSVYVIIRKTKEQTEWGRKYETKRNLDSNRIDSGSRHQLNQISQTVYIRAAADKSRGNRHGKGGSRDCCLFGRIGAGGGIGTDRADSGGCYGAA